MHMDLKKLLKSLSSWCTDQDEWSIEHIINGMFNLRATLSKGWTPCTGDAMSKGRNVQGIQCPKDTSFKGLTVLGTHHLKAKGLIVQGTYHRRRIVLEMHHPRDTSSSSHPWDESSTGHIVPGMHHPRVASSKGRVEYLRRVQSSEPLHTKMPLIILLVGITGCMCTNHDLFRWTVLQKCGRVNNCSWDYLRLGVEYMKKTNNPQSKPK